MQIKKTKNEEKKMYKEFKEKCGASKDKSCQEV